MRNENNAYKRKLIGFSIALHRKAQGFTQEQLAEGIGKSLSYVSHIEADGKDANPTLDTLIDIAEFLKVELHKLLNIENLISGNVKGT